MKGTKLFIGNCSIEAQKKKVDGAFVNINGEIYYKISNYDQMQPFLINLASSSDLWMYISSTGGLTAGRKNPDHSLFPYYTDDKVHESAAITGSKTIVKVSDKDKTMLWEPFSANFQGVYCLERNIYKNTTGNKLIFEEKNIDLELTFSYSWMNSEKFGWIKKSGITNNSDSKKNIEILDGLQNVLPFGVTRFTQNKFSTLLDAYKKNELVKNVNLGLFRMESIPVDKAEPSEALKVTTIWMHGLDNAKFLVSSRQVNPFRLGDEITEETEGKGIKGAFLANSQFSLDAKNDKSWYFVAELNQDSLKVNNLIDYIKNTANPEKDVLIDVEEGSKALRQIVAEADGIQHTADMHNVSRHFSNVLFNVMRGGIFSDNYNIDVEDFKNHISHFNKELGEKYEEFFSSLSNSLEYQKLGQKIEALGDEDIIRLYYEYLPITFGRRHGDPSRPWNWFSIDVKDANGDKKLNYQGNWRDIFQNWEALSLSYPKFIGGMITRFLNASTADGYNPYRITRDGIDWEVPEPDNPWANIGYWGDHQIIYLLKLMEVAKKHFPEMLVSWLDKERFAFANVPYRIKPYDEIVKNPQDSVIFDKDLNDEIEKRVDSYGADAKLILDNNQNVKKVNFTEKILVSFLIKMSNFIPEAGIWMNTLRPEWNDANNALVGYGTSMVTLYYMRRFVVFLKDLYNESDAQKYALTGELSDLFVKIKQVLESNKSALLSGFTDSLRKTFTDNLGEAAGEYRERIYKGYSAARKTIERDELINFFDLCLQYIDQSIDANKRDDNMYNAYNLIKIQNDKISIKYLYEMLEGQVSVLSAGKLSPNEALSVLDAMRNSPLYRPDQESYILYPNKNLPEFLAKNNLSEEIVKSSALLKKLADNQISNIIAKDVNGQYHFNGEFCNAGYLKDALYNLKQKSVVDFTEAELAMVLDIYEEIFDHRSFTGRSGSFYKYEGLGSIYWHMVSKLLLAVGENITNAINEKASTEIINKLKAHYSYIRSGIGAHKSPDKYGSFPFDPYSHTPMMAGVQQPGMTGQVKEDVISRFFELGVSVNGGLISFNPKMVDDNEFITLDKGAIKPYVEFTYCKVPIIYLKNNNRGIEVEYVSGKKKQTDSYTLDTQDSDYIFDRSGKIARIIVGCI